MQIRSLDGDDPATIDLLLPGFQQTMRQDLPDDPPVSAALLARLLQRRRGADRLILAAFDADDVPAGYVKLGLDLGTDLDRAHGSLWVFPAYRRRGTGRALVAAARMELRERGREILLVDAPHTPAAEAFTAAVGGRRVATNLRNRLHLAGWTAHRPDPDAAGVRLVRWNERCPDDLVEQYAGVWARTDAAVNGQAGAAGVTAADVRVAEQQAVDSAHRQYAVAAVDAAGAGLLGYSTLFVRDSPMADSGQTMVLPEHRKRGLATLLKSSLIDWAREENPHLAVLQAWNEADNDAICALNRRLGFRADQQWSTYRVAG